MHIPLEAAWKFTYREYVAVVEAGSAKDKTTDTTPFDEEELATLERMRQMLN